ncbi:MAG: AAA family ATPase [Nitrospiraceae bacterium]
MRSVLVTGVSGVGKSTLSRRAGEHLGMENWDYADLMLRVAPDVSCKDDLRSLPWARRNQIYRQVEMLLAELFKPDDEDDNCVLLENHLSILQDGIIRTFPHEDCRRYNAAGLVVIEADPEDVFRRREIDRHRSRYLGSTMEIERQQAQNRQEAACIVRYLGIPMTVIINRSLESSVSQLVSWVAGVLS